MEDKQKSVIPDLEAMEKVMVIEQRLYDAKVISETLEYVRSFDIKLEGYTRKNKELIKTIKILADQADTKKNNLLNFHSANILQGMLIRDSTFGNETIVVQSIELAKLMIDKLKDEGE